MSDIEAAAALVAKCAERAEIMRQRLEGLGMMNRRRGEEGQKQAAEYALAQAEMDRATTALRAAQAAYAMVPYARPDA